CHDKRRGCDYRDKKFSQIDGADSKTWRMAAANQGARDDWAPAAAADRVQKPANESHYRHPALLRFVRQESAHRFNQDDDAHEGQIDGNEGRNDFAVDINQDTGTKNAPEGAGQSYSSNNFPFDVTMKKMGCARGCGRENLGYMHDHACLER